jgi:hypothetical protein
MNRTSFLYLLFVCLASCVVGVWIWFYPGPTPPPESTPSSALRQLPPAIERQLSRSTKNTSSHPVRFLDGTGAAHLPAIDPTVAGLEGAGIAWLDYDQDGRLDLFLASATGGGRTTCRLFRNAGGRFQEVTQETGLPLIEDARGVAVGDVDNDGYPDLYLTRRAGPGVLLRNRSDGSNGRRFVDWTAQAGLSAGAAAQPWRGEGTSAAFLDYDNDGRLDLLVCRNSPGTTGGLACVLYHNDGNGEFHDVSEEAGIATATRAMGVVALDLDEDGRIDLYVVTDAQPNLLFRNLGEGRFERSEISCGALLSLDGLARHCRGVDADDMNGDGKPELFVTTGARETKGLFRNEGGGQFLDVIYASGLGSRTFHRSAFATCLLDADGDAALDVFLAGTTETDASARSAASLFLGDGRGVFQEAPAAGISAVPCPDSIRGAAAADFDNDGRPDLALGGRGGVCLLHNESGPANNWLRLHLVGTRSNRDAVGARVTVHLPGGRTIVRQRKGGGSFLSSGDPRLLLGLGRAQLAERVEVRWPSGRVQELGPLAAWTTYRVVEGEAAVAVRTQP